jgi:hypothetical protein
VRCLNPNEIRRPSRLITSQTELSFHIALERLANGYTGLGLQSVMRCLLDDLGNFLLSLGDGLGNVGHNLLISNSIADPNTEAIVEKPEVNNHLYASEELPSSLGTLFAKYDVHKTSLRCSDCLLLDNTENELAILYRNAIIEDGIRQLWIGRPVDVDSTRNGQAGICFPSTKVSVSG